MVPPQGGQVEALALRSRQDEKIPFTNKNYLRRERMAAKPRTAKKYRLGGRITAHPPNETF